MDRYLYRLPDISTQQQITVRTRILQSRPGYPGFDHRPVAQFGEAVKHSVLIFDVPWRELS